MDDPGRLSFGAIADRYERGRPTYPDDAVRWLTRDITGSHVLELGAGTGKLTEVLDRQGCLVVATDPDERMLHHLRKALPYTPVAVSAAEEVPLPDDSVDVVVAAQAFHWFDLPRAIPEIARVLKPYGVLSLVWNERDEQVPWVRKLGRAIGGPTQSTDPEQLLAGFDEVVHVEHQTYRHWQTLDRAGLIDMAASRSNIAALEDDEREERLAAVSALYDDYGRGPDGMQLPYVTRCYRVSLRDLRAPKPPPAAASAEPPTEVPRYPGEPTVSMDRADLPLGRPVRPRSPDAESLIDFR